jgi:hypothetical protein
MKLEWNSVHLRGNNFTKYCLNDEHLKINGNIRDCLRRLLKLLTELLSHFLPARN